MVQSQARQTILDLAWLIDLGNQDIYKAIEQQDPEEAAKAAETHLRNAANRLETYINN